MSQLNGFQSFQNSHSSSIGQHISALDSPDACFPKATAYLAERYVVKLHLAETCRPLRKNQAVGSSVVPEFAGLDVMTT